LAPGLNIVKEKFRFSLKNQIIESYLLGNANGIKLRILNYGGIIQSLIVPDRSGRMADVVLGYDTLEAYFDDAWYLGVLVGRCGNRIGNSTFELEGKNYQVSANLGKHHLHGGFHGFNHKVWQAEAIQWSDEVRLKLFYLSRDGEEGYPGNLQTTVIYSLNNRNELLVDYSAVTDQSTPVNMTQHSYFNLTGDPLKTITNHVLWLNADHITAADDDQIVTGELMPVSGTPFDFIKPACIADGINADHPEIRKGHGYDHNWVFRDWDQSMKLQGSLLEPVSGRFMEVLTTEPAVQLYCGNFMNGSRVGKNAIPLNYRCGLCLETQHFPDSPNKPQFPSTILRPGMAYRTQTIYRFSSK
jgi:aldose 1-epimerase